MTRRIIYAQYTNPANYPPLLHSSRILAELGWDVLLLGITAQGTRGLADTMHPAIRLELMPYQAPGLWQKTHYLKYAASVLNRLGSWDADWCYASDLWSCPIGLAATQLNIPVIYHEHDEPADVNTITARACLGARAALAGQARVCVFPNQRRLERFSTLHPDARTVRVWNCPSLGEVAEPRGDLSDHTFVLYYHGSIVPERVPLTLIHALAALPGAIQLQLRGYETIGARGHAAAILDLAKRLGVADRVEVLQVVERAALWKQLDAADVGLSLLPLRASDANLEFMAGASNKPFEYLARGLALLLPARAEWHAMYGPYGLSCDPDDAGSIARAIKTLYDDRLRTRELGEAGRQRIAAEWNYEREFEPLLAILHE